MNNLVFHDHTKQTLDRFIANPQAAGLLLVGPTGIGKQAVAEYIVDGILGSSDRTSCLIIEPEKRSISIEQIRGIHHFLRLKTVGKGTIRRFVLIRDADSMGTEAQNALLKLLEEPPNDTILILTTSQPRRLLPTIRSRVQSISLQIPPYEVLQEAFRPAISSDSAFQRLYNLSGGLPGLLTALLDEDTTHPLYGAVEVAKQLIQATRFDRLVMLEAASKKKEDLLDIFLALEHIASVGLTMSVTTRPERVRNWHLIRKAAYNALDAMEKNANTRLVVTNTALAW